MVNKARRLATWARLGYLARGVVYILLAYVALSSGRALSTGDAVEKVGDLPGGSIILFIVALGLFGYGLFKILSAWSDLDDKGRDGKGAIVRVGKFLGGLAYWALAFVAARALLRGGQAESGTAAGSSGMQQDMATEVAQAPGGGALLIVVGLVAIAMAVAQLVIAARAKFMDDMSPAAPPFTKWAGQAGYAARGLVAAMVGWFVLQAGIDGERVRNFGDALAVIQQEQSWLFTPVAVGLLLFGIVSLIMARYRTIPDADVIGSVKGAAHGPR